MLLALLRTSGLPGFTLLSFGSAIPANAETPDAATVTIRPGYEWEGHEAGQYLRIGLAQRIERCRRVPDLVAADVLQGGRQLLGPGLGLELLAMLPEQIAPDGDQKQDDRARDEAAIALGALGHLVAAEVFVDFANEAFSGIGGERQ